MQIEVLRVEKLNRHRELGYQAVLKELTILSWNCVHPGDHGISYTLVDKV
jgi:hypothetical protein